MPPPGIPALAWDLGISTAVGATSIGWVKLWTGLARRDKMKPQVNNERNLIFCLILSTSIVVQAVCAYLPTYMMLFPMHADPPP